MNIIIIPSISWRFPLYQRVHHFADILSKQGNNVLFIEPCKTGENGFVRDRVEVYANPAIFGMLSTVGALGGRKNHWFLEAFFSRAKNLATPFYGKIMGLRRRIFGEKLSAAAKQEYEKKFFEYSNAEQKIVFYQAPYLTEFIPFFKSNGFKIVYDMVDEVSEFKESPEFFKKAEERLLKEADLVTATALPLLERAKKCNSNTLLLPNAVEYNLFAQARQRLEKPHDLNFNGPIIGYYGAIWDWFDCDLLVFLAQGRPHWSFVLIGTIHPKVHAKIKGVKNIHYLGEKAYCELPNYLSWFSACIIPFKNSKLIKSVNPVKVYEFLAAGKSVVSTPMKEIAWFPGVSIAQVEAEFLEKLDLAMKHAPDLKIVDFFLKDKTWQSRVNAFNCAIENLFGKKTIADESMLQISRKTKRKLFEKINIVKLAPAGANLVVHNVENGLSKVVSGKELEIIVPQNDSFAGVVLSTSIAKPGKKYLLSISAKANKNGLLSEFCDYANSNKILAQNRLTQNWEDYSFSFIAPNGSFSLLVNLTTYGNSPGTMKIREISIYELEE